MHYVYEREGPSETGPRGLGKCTGLPEPFLFAKVISNLSTWASSFKKSFSWHSSIYNSMGHMQGCHMSHLMTKPTKWHVRPAKTQISLGIRPHEESLGP